MNQGMLDTLKLEEEKKDSFLDLQRVGSSADTLLSDF